MVARETWVDLPRMQEGDPVVTAVATYRIYDITETQRVWVFRNAAYTWLELWCAGLAEYGTGGAW